MEEILWPSFSNRNGYEENKALDIIKSQAEALKVLTNGKIQAVLSHSINDSETIKALNELSQATKRSLILARDKLSPELAGKKDINDLFDSQFYKFEIFSDSYRFRVFSLEYTVNYPIALEIDEGIAKEYFGASYIQKVNNNEDLKRLLKKIFTSKKMYTIVNYIMMNS